MRGQSLLRRLPTCRRAATASLEQHRRSRGPRHTHTVEMQASSADIDERVMNSQGLSVASYDVTERYTADCGDDTKVAMHDDLAGEGGCGLTECA